MTTITNPSSAQCPIVQLCGNWFDAAESSQLVAAPRFWIDDAGQLWTAVGDEAGQRVHVVEYLSALPLVLVVADEMFLVSVDDYARPVS